MSVDRDDAVGCRIEHGAQGALALLQVDRELAGVGERAALCLEQEQVVADRFVRRKIGEREIEALQLLEVGDPGAGEKEQVLPVAGETKLPAERHGERRALHDDESAALRAEGVEVEAGPGAGDREQRRQAGSGHDVWEQPRP